METIRERLKNETAALHKSTENRSALIPLFRGGVWTNEIANRYKSNIAAQGALIDYLSKSQDQWKHKIPSALNVLESISSIEKDFNGSSPETFKLDSFAGSDADFAIGVAYVILGSSMGSKVILSKLGEIIPVQYQHFLQAMADASVHFRAFCEEVNAPNIDADEAVLGAVKAFEYLNQYS